MTSMQSNARSAYTQNAVGTASPSTLLVMLFDRLVLDCERGLRATMARDNLEANKQYVHAQSIVSHLQGSLDPEGWSGGRELMALYAYLQRRLIQANVRHDVKVGREVVALTRHLRDTWKRAAQLVDQGAS
ncbi:flagellar export chaperone FliS [Nocardioides sp. BP30]|uniref:flagellar export chaperone FliS n=1 Tax=Nocardioides sp. BP30 TaxID=3036374 RepID=UPI0024699F55|nr:flagellar export chaperone FliS [Nocardioides sp. BP30]WGL51903.1 flagellar export chaperone FliS [Nocardioides sp. BP30]